MFRGHGVQKLHISRWFRAEVSKFKANDISHMYVHIHVYVSDVSVHTYIHTCIHTDRHTHWYVFMY